MMYETDHHLTIDGLPKVFRTYEEAQTAAEARARGREKLRSVETLAGTDFRYEFGLTVETPGVREERGPVPLATKQPAGRQT